MNQFPPMFSFPLDFPTAKLAERLNRIQSALREENRAWYKHLLDELKHAEEAVLQAQKNLHEHVAAYNSDGSRK